ncbi:MAG: YeeE/YedE family protein [Pseudomonadota bacterium]
MEMTAGILAMLLGAVGGIVLGITARVGRFCTLGAIEDAMLAGNFLRMRIWVMAMAVAVLGTALLNSAGLIDISQSFLAERPLNLMTLISGGLAFGVGMALVGTCGFGTLVRLGGGDLKSFVVFLVIGISAYMAAAGPTALFRQSFLDDFALDPAWVGTPLLGDLMARTLGMTPLNAGLTIAVILTACALITATASHRRRTVLIGGVVGLVIVWGWFVTGYVASDPFEPVPVASYAFIRGLGASVLFLMASSGTEVGFGIGATVGVLLGSLCAAVWKREFRWEANDDVTEQKRHIIGAFLMGTGGMFALGCTIGQGLTAVSMLALSAPIVLASIGIGAWLGLHYVVEGTIAGALRAIVGAPIRASNARSK